MTKDKSSLYTDVTDNVFSLWDEFSRLMENYLEKLSAESSGEYQELYEHWEEYREKAFEQISRAASVESPDALSDMFKKWIDLSSDFGSVLESFKGKNFPDEVDELYQDYMKKLGEPILQTLSLSMTEQFKRQEDLYNLWIDSWAKLSEDEEFNELLDYCKERWTESTGNMSAKIMSALKKGDTEGLLRGMELEWMKTASEMIQKILLSRPYAMAQGTYIGNLMDTRITQRELMDTYLKSLGMPTRDDMLKLYESVHELTSRIRSIERKLDNLPMD